MIICRSSNFNTKLTTDGLAVEEISKGGSRLSLIGALQAEFLQAPDRDALRKFPAIGGWNG